VTGQLGGPALALAMQQKGQALPEVLRKALTRPQPQLAAGEKLRSLASACIDVSDGLAADLGHLLTASKAGATVQLDQLPRSEHLVADQRGWRWALAGGDDYQLCFTVPSSKADELRQAMKKIDCSVTQIGRIDEKPGMRLFLGTEPVDWNVRGFDHFAQ